MVRCSWFDLIADSEKEHRTWQVQRSIAIDVSVAISWNARNSGVIR
jgi:hypothetical protein